MAGKDDAPDYLNMSDEELLNASAPTPAPVEEEEEDTEQEAPAEENPEPEDTPEEEVQEESEEEEEPADDEEPQEEEEDQQEEPTQKPKAEAKQADKPAFDYEAEYKKLLAPFKANGREIKVDTVDEAVALMQMGANYNKKMAALKPNLKLLKLLEHNNLLSEEKISFLIDLDKKNPDAINKLVKDSGIDPLDLDTEKASSYKQTAYTVDDKAFELDQVLEEIQDTPSYAKTLDVVGNKLDAQSKALIAQTPQLLKIINDHVQSGVYDRIMQEIDKERMYGRLSGMSDIEAYRKVGDALHAQGAFNPLIQGRSQTQGKPTNQQGNTQSRPMQGDDDKLKNKKRAASSARTVPQAQTQDFDPLSMSDEEFNKLVSKKYL